jgi:hypothetical protein
MLTRCFGAAQSSSVAPAQTLTLDQVNRWETELSGEAASRPIHALAIY